MLIPFLSFINMRITLATVKTMKTFSTISNSHTLANTLDSEKMKDRPVVLILLFISIAHPPVEHAVQMMPITLSHFRVLTTLVPTHL